MTDSPTGHESLPPTPADGAPPSPATTPATPATAPASPLYKGEPLDAERGPGLGCFWAQAVVLVVVLLLIPLGVNAQWPIWATGLLLTIALVLVLFVSLTVIFLLRLVSADRRSRRRPLRSGARPTVGQLEDHEEGMRQ
ncbi:MAG TPA: hypothetical protein VEI48_02170 [Candidatus Sulfotelmatobacter sp.]|nr:hypothetical protein [Candidatus Sulfotelmatobacter sp.]